ncbi:hypothetical protein IP70_15705 [alpha proteobacterium AAP38]|nr:hypothetical protein IP70_15705 [alpha proteobacterium AAP38]
MSTPFGSAALEIADVDPAWSTAVPDWEQRILNQQPLVPELPLFKDEADYAVRVFNRLRIPDLAGRPTFAEVGGAWFLDIVRVLFGSYDAANDNRRIQEVFLLVPKKNSKTTNGAGIMVTWLIVNPVHNAEGLLIAPTKTIAELAFTQAKNMIRADAELVKLFHIQDHLRKITHKVSNAVLQVKAADTDAITGSKAHVTLIDEVHVFASHPRAADVFLELRGALTARPGGFLMMITTQSKKAPAGVFKSELERARAVRDGKLNLPLLAVLYELPKSMQQPANTNTPPVWRNPDTFALVNPNMGRSARPEFLLQQMQSAEREGVEALALFASQYLNVEIGVGLSTDGWSGAKFWIMRARPLTLEDMIDRCEVITIGGDGGGLDDLLGFAAVGRERETKKWLGWAHALIGPQGFKLRVENQSTYQDFMNEGTLTLVEGLPHDLEWFRDHVAIIKDAGLLAQVGLDPAGIGGIVDALADIDVTQENGLLTGVAQGIRLMAAAKTLERKLVDGSFEHDGSRLMAWCVGNARTRQTSTAVMIERAASGYGKIDPFMALLNAAHLMSGNPQPANSSATADEIFAGMVA